MGTVVDACVLRSAGESGKPAPSECRAVLDTILREALVAVVSDELLAEWRKHKSRYASGWLVAMYARRKIRRVEAFSGRADHIDNAISKLSEPDRSIAVKDVHLVKLAVDFDKCVVSSERLCRAAFHKASVHCSELRSTVWIFPDSGQSALDVIKGAVAPPTSWSIGAPP